MDVFGIVTNGDGDVQIIPKMARGVGFQPIRTGYDIALLLKKLRQPAHAGTADADHVDPLAAKIPDVGYSHRFHPFRDGVRARRSHAEGKQARKINQ